MEEKNLQNSLKSIAVFCASSDGIDSEIIETSKKLGSFLAKNDIRLIYGGNDVLYVSIHSLHRITRFTGKDGNWCLSDVLQALKWVQLHISEFGGDPDCVTLMGYSVGGMIVDALMSSPLSQGLFHR